MPKTTLPYALLQTILPAWNLSSAALAVRSRLAALASFLLGVCLLASCMPGQTNVAVQSFTLINADTQYPVPGYDPIPSGATLNLATLPTRNLNIRANTQPAAVGSVRFVFGTENRIDNAPPYAMAGDTYAVYNKWTPPLGALTVAATAYTVRNASGTASATIRLTLNVVSTSPATSTPTPTTTTVNPAESNEVLYNPGMGFADFHFGWGKVLTPAEYPTSRVAYFRWAWADLEPTQGQFNFALVDQVIAQAKAKNERLAFRIMPGIPSWLAAQGVRQIGTAADAIPDHNHPLFVSYHERLIQAFGLRYAGKADIDHVDIGSVGCWGEWNSACCPSGQGAACSALMPSELNRRAVADWYYKYFRNTPLVALAEGTGYPNTLGAGWRGDCFGDYGIFSSRWNHMVNFYPDILQKAEVANAWQKAPVQFEACGKMQDWYDRGFDIDLILQRGLDWHMSVFNGKNSPIPAEWRPKVEAWLKKIGYRFVLTRLTHGNDIVRGGQMQLQASWANRGVAPAYRPWPIAWRLRNSSGAIVAQWRSRADVRTMLPGAHSVQDTVQIPATVAAGTYYLDLAILNEAGNQAFVQLANAGKRADLWYAVSQVRIR